MAVTPPLQDGSSEQPETDLVSRLRHTAAAIDAAGISGQPATGQAGPGGAATRVDNPDLLLHVHHFRKMAALCSVAARLLLERASSGQASGAGTQDARDSDAQSVRRFLEAQLAEVGDEKAQPREPSAPPCPAPPPPQAGLVPSGGRRWCACSRSTDGTA